MRTRFAGCDAALLAEAHNRFGVVSPFGGPTSSGMVTLHCPPAQLYALGSFLRDHGADTVSVASLDYVLDRDNPLFARLESFLRPDAVEFRSSWRQHGPVTICCFGRLPYAVWEWLDLIDDDG